MIATFEIGRKKALIKGILMMFFNIFSFGSILAVLWFGGK